jgi:multidrug efflux system outer membrane protein
VGDHTEARKAIDKEWWKNFQDPYLDNLVEKAIAGNITLRIAATRIEEAEAILGGTRAGWWPTLNANVSAPYNYTGQDLPEG